MGINLDSSLSSYAQTAGVSQSDLNDPKKATGAADKVLEAVASSPSASKQVIDQAIALDASAVDQSASGSKDTFADFQNHVSQLVTNSAVSTDLNGLAADNAITNNSTINAFVTALSNTLQGGGAGAMQLTGMTVDNGNFSKHGIHHDDTKVTASVGTGNSNYVISFDQRNSADNVLSITDPDGNSVPIPDNLQGGNASGSMTLPGGTKITIDGTGPNCSFTITDPQGRSQTATFHGAGAAGWSKISPITSGSTGSGGSASSPSGSSAPSNGIVFNPETDLDPLWIASTESALAEDYAKKYGVSVTVFENGASDEWIQGSKPGTNVAQELSGDAQDTGIQGEVYRAGEEFAAHYQGGGRSTTPSTPPQFTPLPDPNAPNSGAQGNNTTSSTSGGSGTGGSNGSSGAYSGGPIPGQNTQLDPSFVATLETQALNQIPTQLQALFLAAAQDTWGQEWNKGSYTLSPAGQAYQAGKLSGAEREAYELGLSFAKKYYGGGTQTTLSGNPTNK